METTDDELLTKSYTQIFICLESTHGRWTAIVYGAEDRVLACGGRKLKGNIFVSEEVVEVTLTLLLTSLRFFFCKYSKLEKIG